MNASGVNNGYMKGHPALTEEQLDDIADAYLGGATTRTLAALYGVAQQAIACRLRQRGISGGNRNGVLGETR